MTLHSRGSSRSSHAKPRESIPIPTLETSSLTRCRTFKFINHRDRTIKRKINRLLVASFRLRCWCISRKKILWKLVTVWYTHTHTHVYIPRKRSTCRRYRWCNDALPRYPGHWGRHYGEIENIPVRRKNSNKRCTKGRKWFGCAAAQNVTFIFDNIDGTIDRKRSSGCWEPRPVKSRRGNVETSPETRVCYGGLGGLTLSG